MVDTSTSTPKEHFSFAADGATDLCRDLPGERSAGNTESISP